jgi:superfamily I DNA/RNA helicase
MLRAHYPGGVAKPVPIFDGAAEDARIRFYDVPSDKSEARIVAGLSKKKIKTGSVIIIIPNRKYLPPIEDALRRSGVNFTYKRDPDPGGLVRFAVLADWAEDPDDNIALRYLLDLIVQNNDSLTRKVQADAKTLTAKRLAAQEEIAGLWSGVGGKKSLYRVLCQRAAAENKDSYLASLRSCVDEAMSSLSANGRKREELPVFLQRCGLLVAPGKTPAGIINEVREWRARELSATSSSSYQPVRIYNMPSSKGLEAETVMVIGLSEGLFPKPGADIAENSRLLYVAMTRARKELHLFSARRRPANITFQAQSYQLKSSPFIDAIPAAHILKKYLQSTKK